VKEDFLIEEYKIKWSYLLHLEGKWDSVLKWYTAIVGALAGLSMGPARIRDVRTEQLRIPVLFFTVTYSLFVCLYLITQKRSYRAYHRRVVEIEHELLGAKVRPGYSGKESIASTSRIYLGFPSLIGGGLLGLLVFACCGNITFSSVAGGVFVFGILGLTFWNRIYFGHVS